MPRLARVDTGNQIYHVINRANGRLQIFESDKDYELFEELLQKTQEETNEESEDLENLDCRHLLPLTTTDQLLLN